MIRLHKTIASCFGIGNIKGGGTIAALATCVAWYLVQADGSFQKIMIPITVFLTGLGVWSANKVEPHWGEDSNRVVIDEVAGMCIGLLFVPVAGKYLMTGLVLFRFFDIVKPLFIRRAEKLPAGWGVMADDVLAGVYTNIVLQVIIHFNVI